MSRQDNEQIKSSDKKQDICSINKITHQLHGPFNHPSDGLEASITSGASLGATYNPQQTTAGQNDVCLKKTVGLWSGASIIVGCIVGSGIFVSPKGVLVEAGSVGASLVVWFACGILALLGSLCFAELGTSIASSGGDYTYIGLAYGPLPAFLFLWVTVVVIMPCSTAVAALTFANYILQPLFPGCAPPEDALRLLALLVLLLLVYLNCASIEASIRVQNTFTLAKVVALVVIICVGLVWLAQGRSPSALHVPWQNTSTSLPHLAQAFYAGFYTYAGWNSLNCVTEELRNPVRNMPLALFMSISAITGIYVLTNLAYFAVLDPSEILASDAIAVSFGSKALGLASWLMPLCVALSTVGGLNGSIFACSRILLTGAREGHLFSALNMINVSQSTPIPSLLLLGLVSSLYLFTTKIYQLINYMVFVEATFSALAVSTVLVLRRKMPHLERPIRVPVLVPLAYLLFSFFLIVLPIVSSPIESAIGIGIMLSGVPVYYITARWTNKPLAYQRLIDRFNKFCQKLTVSVAPSRASIVE